jgi:transcriptional regulator with XRE-family HTH domain
MNYKELLIEMEKQLGTQKAVADQVGVSQPTISAWLSGKSLKADNLFRIIKAANRMGIGAAPRPRHIDYEYGAARVPDPTIIDERAEVIDLGSDITGQVAKSLSDPPSMKSSTRVREVDVKLGAGGGGLEFLTNNHTQNGVTFGVDVVKDDAWVIPTSFLQWELKIKPDAAWIAEIYGDSGFDPSNPNAPGSLFPGDRVVIDTADRNPSPPGPFAVYDGNGLVVKLIELIFGSDPLRISLSSRNPLYRTYDATVDEVRIIGRVKGRITSM